MSRWELQHRLAEAMRLREMTQEELARVTGLQPSAISHFVSGNRKPNFDNIRKIALGLKVTSDFLLGLSTLPTGTKSEQAVLGHLERLTYHNRMIADAVIHAILQTQEKP